MEWITIAIAGLGLVISCVNTFRLHKHDKEISNFNKRSLEIEQIKLYSEFGTPEDIALEKRNLLADHSAKIANINRKWSDERSRIARAYAASGGSDSSEARQTHEKAKENCKMEIESEKREYNLKVKKLESRENLLKEKLQK